MDNENYAGWRGLSPVDKFLYHIFDRVPEALGGFYMVYLALALLLIAFLWSQEGNGMDARSIFFPLVFILLSVCSVMVFVVVPTMPERSGNTSLFFLLLALTFIADMLTDGGKRRGFFALCAVTAVCGVCFILSYTLVSYAYMQVRTQAAIREDVIGEARASGEKTAVIPDWFYTRLAKYTDRLDMYRQEKMAEYYGLEEIEWQEVAFNYAVIRNTEPIQVDRQIRDGLTLNNVFVKFHAPFEQTIVFEFDGPMKELIKEGYETFYVRLGLDGNGRTVTLDLDLSDLLQIGDRYYAGWTMLLGPRSEGPVSAEFGFYDPYTGAHIDGGTLP